jgi:ABC-type polysaccharide/polyol phosphate export permease
VEGVGVRKARTPYLRELLARRELLGYLVRSNLKAMHRYTLLGYFWWMLEPLLLMGIYVIVVGELLGAGREAFPVYVFCALLPWRAFLNSVNNAMSTVAHSGRIIRLVAFPKAILPIADVLTNYVNLLFGVPILLGLACFFGISFTPHLLWFPLIIALQLALTLGVALFFSAVNIYVRDTENLSKYLFRALWYLSPGFYGLDRIPAHFLLPYKLLNPFAVFFTAYRDVVMYGRSPDFGYLAWAGLVSLVALVVGGAAFVRLERGFVKVI